MCCCKSFLFSISLRSLSQNQKRKPEKSLPTEKVAAELKNVAAESEKKAEELEKVAEPEKSTPSWKTLKNRRRAAMSRCWIGKSQRKPPLSRKNRRRVRKNLVEREKVGAESKKIAARKSRQRVGKNGRWPEKITVEPEKELALRRKKSPSNVNSSRWAGKNRRWIGKSPCRNGKCWIIVEQSQLQQKGMSVGSLV